MQEYNAPFTLREVFNLKDLGIGEQFITFRNLTISDKYICVRVTSPYSSVIIIDMNKPMHPLRRQLRADSALVNPILPILASKVRILGTNQDNVQIIDLETNLRIKSYSKLSVEFWKWISPKMLGLITETAVYHWSIEDTGELEPVKMFDRTANPAISHIVSYECDTSMKWLVLIGMHHPNSEVVGYPLDSDFFLSIDKPNLREMVEINLEELVERNLEELEKRNAQLFSVNQQRSYDLKACAASFATFKLTSNKTPSSCICYVSKTVNADQISSTLHILELADRFSAANNMEVDMTFPPDFQDDFPVGLQISEKYGLIYIVTKLGFLFVYDLETTTPLYRHRISPVPVLITIEAAISGGIYTINLKGQVFHVGVNEATLVSYTRDQLNNLELALNIAKRAKLPGCTDLVVQEFENLFARKKYKEAAEMSAEYLVGIFQTSEAANSQILKRQLTESRTLLDEKAELERQLTESKALLDEKAELERQLTESRTLLEKIRKEQVELQTEKDNAVKERDHAFKKLDLCQMKGGQSSSPSASLIEFTYSELEQATNNFDESLKIGEGGFGSVYRGFLRHTTVAIKVLKHGSSQGDIEYNQEVEILTKVRHPNLITLIGTSSEALALVYEFLPNGNLDTFLTNDECYRRKLTWQDRIRIASEICSALIFLHSIPPHGIAHGDLKPENILLDFNYVSKLSDFGISRKLQQSNKTLTPFHLTESPKYTPAYGDPEFFSSYKLTPKSDIYSFGIVLLQLVTGREPRGMKDVVEEAMDNGMFGSVVDGFAGKWPIEEAEKLASLGLWCSDPSKRRRPHLGKDVWPVIESMKCVAESTLKERC